MDPSLFISAVELNGPILDKSSGAPLSGGTLYFFQDSQRTTPKPVYQLTGNPGSYTFVDLPNPLTLSITGTLQDTSGNQIPIYYYPYDSSGNPQTYYVVCYNSDGTEQFTYQNWPSGIVSQNISTTTVPTASYLVGWDFATNPAQIGTTFGTSAIGANTSFYTWDQTIIYQSLSGGVSVTFGPNDEYEITAAVQGTQCAIVQYLDSYTVQSILNSPMSSMVMAKTSNANGIAGTVSMWYGTGSALPVVAPGTNHSIVHTLDINGHPATTYAPTGGVWVEIPRAGGNALFTVGRSSTTNFNPYPFSGWSLGGAPATQTASWYAIVVGFGPMNLGDTISIGSVSCVPGNVPTIPAVQTIGETWFNCNRYYSSSFPYDTTPAPGTNLGGYVGFETVVAGGTQVVSPTVQFPNQMRVASPIIVVYAPSSTHPTDFLPQNSSTGNICQSYLVYFIGSKAFSLNITPDLASGVNNLITYHWSADARLGVI